MTIPDWAKPLVAARERGATLQLQFGHGEWVDFGPGKCASFYHPPSDYRIKPGTDPGERTVDPLIWGASVPGTEPVPVREDAPLTFAEVQAFWMPCNLSAVEICRNIYRAGREGRRTP